MTYKAALEIIDVQPVGKHEYRLTCRTCGKSLKVDTDYEVGPVIEMAKEHEKCKKEASDGTVLA